MIGVNKMEYYDDDFYNDLSGFDIEVNELKKKLSEQVKKEFLDKLQELEEENKRLQDIKNNWNKLMLESVLQNEELEREKYKSKQYARNARLDELFQDKQFVLYKPSCDYIEKEKCKHCDNERKLHFKTPEGKDVSAPCDCSNKTVFYKPVPLIAYQFSLEISGYKRFNIYYKEIDKNFYDCDYTTFLFGESIGLGDMDIVENETDFEKTGYNHVFKSEELCQKFCDWQNARMKK